MKRVTTKPKEKTKLPGQMGAKKGNIGAVSHHLTAKEDQLAGPGNDDTQLIFQSQDEIVAYDDIPDAKSALRPPTADGVKKMNMFGGGDDVSVTSSKVG